MGFRYARQMAKPDPPQWIPPEWQIATEQCRCEEQPCKARAAQRVVDPATGREQRLCLRHAKRFALGIRARVAAAKSRLNHLPWEKPQDWERGKNGSWKPRGQDPASVESGEGDPPCPATRST